MGYLCHKYIRSQYRIATISTVQYWFCIASFGNTETSKRLLYRYSTRKYYLKMQLYVLYCIDKWRSSVPGTGIKYVVLYSTHWYYGYTVLCTCTVIANFKNTRTVCTVSTKDCTVLLLHNKKSKKINARTTITVLLLYQ